MAKKASWGSGSGSFTGMPRPRPVTHRVPGGNTGGPAAGSRTMKLVRAIVRFWNQLCELDARTALRPVPVPVRK